jgi:dihydroorotase
VLGIPGGSLAVGQPADVALIDPQTPFTLAPERLRSSGRNTPFAGWRLRGRVVRVWCGTR